MALKVIFGSLLSIIGLILLFLGTMFLIASKGDSTRMVVGVVFLVGAAFCFASGILLIKKGQSLNPAAVRDKILGLARINQGVLREEVVIGNLGNNDVVTNALHFFVVNKLAERVSKNGFVTYRFPDFHIKLVVKQCPYCGNDYSMRSGIEECPTCGGDLKMQTARVDKEQDLLNLDE